MPSLNEKVILTIKLELGEILKDLKKVKNEVKEIQGKGKKREGEELKHHKLLTAAERTSHKERRKRIKELEDDRKKEKKGGTEAIQNLKKQNILFRDLSQVQKGMQDRTAAFAKKHRYLAGMGRAGMGIGKGIGGAARAGIGLAGAAGAAGLGFFLSGIMQNYQTYLQVGAAKGQLTGMGMSSNRYAAALGKTGAGGAALGYTPTETYGHARAVGRATGNIGAVYRAQQFARAGGGMDVGEATGIMGQLRQGGTTFQTGTDPYGRKKEGSGVKALEKLMAAGMATGIEKARLPEYLQGIGSLIEAQGGRQAGVVDVDAMAKSVNMIMGLTGMTGKRGIAMANQMQQMITAPGGGEAGQALVMQSMGFGKPGGKATYYEAMKQQEKGISDPKNMMNLLKEVYTQYGSVGAGGKSPANQEANLVLKEMSGINLNIWEKVGDMAKAGKSQKEIDKEIEKMMKENGPIDKQALDETKKGFSDTIEYLAQIQEWQRKMGEEFAPQIKKLEELQRAAMDVLVAFIKDNIPAITRLLEDIREAIKYMMPKDTKEEFEKYLNLKSVNLRENVPEYAKPVNAAELAEKIGPERAAYVAAGHAKNRIKIIDAGLKRLEDTEENMFETETGKKIPKTMFGYPVDVPKRRVSAAEKLMRRETAVKMLNEAPPGMFGSAAGGIKSALFSTDPKKAEAAIKQIREAYQSERHIAEAEEATNEVVQSLHRSIRVKKEWEAKAQRGPEPDIDVTELYSQPTSVPTRPRPPGPAQVPVVMVPVNPAQSASTRPIAEVSSQPRSVPGGR